MTHQKQYRAKTAAPSAWHMLLVQQLQCAFSATAAVQQHQPRKVDRGNTQSTAHWQQPKLSNYPLSHRSRQQANDGSGTCCQQLLPISCEGCCSHSAIHLEGADALPGVQGNQRNAALIAQEGHQRVAAGGAGDKALAALLLAPQDALHFLHLGGCQVIDEEALSAP